MIEKERRRSALRGLATLLEKPIEEVKPILDELIKQEEVVLVPITQIKNPPFHDRRIYDEGEVRSLARNIEDIGLLNPIIVRKKNGGYERISGFRRLEAYKYLYSITNEDKWLKIPAIVLDVDDTVALKIMLSENIFREDLNDYDEAIAQIEYIRTKLGMSEPELRSLIYRYFGTGKLTEDDENTILKIEEIAKELNLSLRTLKNRIRLLSVHPKLIDAIEKREITGIVALELNRLSDREDVMMDLLERYKKGELSVKTLKEEITKILDNNNEDETFAKETKNKIKVVFSKVSKIKDREKLEKINELIKELEKILEGGNV